MGFFAGAVNGNDSTPGEDFSTPPPDNAPTGTLTGTVTDSGTGQPLAGVTITVARQGGGRLNNPSSTTGADGKYSIPNLVVGTYPKVAVASGGFDPVQVPVTIGTGTTVQDFSTRRDWAAASGGAAITAFDGPDYTPFGCGPGGAIRPVADRRMGQRLRPGRRSTRSCHAEVHHDRPAHRRGHHRGLGRSERHLW